MKKSEIVFNYICEKINCNYIKKCIESDTYLGIGALEIQNEFNIVRNNASTLLNDLLKAGKLIKVNGRPVTFFPKVTLEKMNINITKDAFSPEEFKDILNINKKNNDFVDPFTFLIGYNNSLLHQIEQAKAAVMYPHNGLHILLLGESGVGKTTFASMIYKYALQEKKKTEESFPFISFNCSDYYNAPQLLISQLFGHIKGAFTGADSDKIGLVEKANNGILFLDEVHRLPPDGQEMLFYLMDKGEFSRLGETSKPRKSNVLIIAATTENPDDTFLNTFLRRIPVTITLPAFRDKTLDERFEVIETLFHYESIKLNMPIKIPPEVLKALALYQFIDGNIGQLTSEIKLLCAKAFFEHLQSNKELVIEFKTLNSEIRENLFNDMHISSSDKTFLNMYSENLIINPHVTANEDTKLKIISKDIDIYDSINKKLEELKDEGLSISEIENEITNTLEDTFNNVINKFNPNSLNIRKLYSVVPKQVVDTCTNLINVAQAKLGTKFSNKFFFGFTFHIYSLLKRIEENKPIVNPNMAIIKRQYKKEFEVSSELLRILDEKFAVLIPEDEKGFLSVLLANNNHSSKTTDLIGVVLVCHGDSTASSMGAVANKLLNVNNIKAIDMPLDATVPDTYEKVKNAVINANSDKGVFLLVDMGSLCQFGERIMDETGIKVRTINNISTLFVLDILRSVLYQEYDIDTLYDSLVKDIKAEHTAIKSKKKAIITVCTTGQGVGLISKNIIKDLIKDKYNDAIEIININYFDMENNINDLQEKYDILACIGSLKPSINIPYFPINKILNKNFQNEFTKLLDANLISSSSEDSKEENTQKSIYEISKEMLEEYIKYVNPKIAIASIKKFITKLDLPNRIESDDYIIDLIIHMGCMLDRCIHGDMVKFKDLDSFKNSNRKQFDEVKQSISVIEGDFRIKISDDEICYIVKILNR
ncbi:MULTISPECIES: sigma 54-interacting transcriptional regulator [Clostridium]|uniref:sigma 54-interacting transcriptional regulator n=1 Tax=Clostridium TaxID=1485 RepID=UPI0008255A91|nr:MULTISPECIES: sigma-54-dependent transcriptional regulator [Clostridium]PJI08016.1 sigma-54-dependent transcriptional regulator [Clostridium sp. CT7]